MSARLCTGVKDTSPSSNTKRHEAPSDNGATRVDGVLPHRETECRAGGQTSLREEVGRVAHEGTATEGLDDPTPGRDLGAAQVGALEAVEVGRPGNALSGRMSTCTSR